MAVPMRNRSPPGICFLTTSRRDVPIPHRRQAGEMNSCGDHRSRRCEATRPTRQALIIATKAFRPRPFTRPMLVVGQEQTSIMIQALTDPAAMPRGCYGEEISGTMMTEADRGSGKASGSFRLTRPVRASLPCCFWLPLLPESPRPPGFTPSDGTRIRTHDHQRTMAARRIPQPHGGEAAEQPARQLIAAAIRNGIRSIPALPFGPPSGSPSRRLRPWSGPC